MWRSNSLSVKNRCTLTVVTRKQLCALRGVLRIMWPYLVVTVLNSAPEHTHMRVNQRRNVLCPKLCEQVRGNRRLFLGETGSDNNKKQLLGFWLMFLVLFRAGLFTVLNCAH